MSRYTVIVREIQVVGRLWSGVKGAYSRSLTQHDVEQIGELTRENISNWIDSHFGDFESITDFHADLDDFDSPWDDEDSEMFYMEVMYEHDE